MINWFIPLLSREKGAGDEAKNQILTQIFPPLFELTTA
jgi:hypothetical protein